MLEEDRHASARKHAQQVAAMKGQFDEERSALVRQHNEDVVRTMLKCVLRLPDLPVLKAHLLEKTNERLKQIEVEYSERASKVGRHQ